MCVVCGVCVCVCVCVCVIYFFINVCKYFLNIYMYVCVFI